MEHNQAIKEEMKRRKANYPSTLQFVKGEMPRKRFWKCFFSIDPNDYWNWIFLAIAVFLFWWSFKIIFAAFG